MNERRSLIKTLWDRKKNWIGHVVRGDGLMKLVLEGRMEGKRPRGRPRIYMIDDVLDETYGDMKRKAETERFGEFGSQGPALGQETNDGDDDAKAQFTAFLSRLTDKEANSLSPTKSKLSPSPSLKSEPKLIKTNL